MLSCVWGTHDKKHDSITLSYYVLGGPFDSDKIKYILY